MTETIDATMLAAALGSGFRRVIGDRQELNRINVFPVPDADTGTNLVATLGNAATCLDASRHDHAGRLLEQVCDTLFDDARGNSGALLAQFFQGFSDASLDAQRIDAATLRCAFDKGANYACRAVAAPADGTMLTVMSACAAAVAACGTAAEPARVSALLKSALDAARNTLAATTAANPALRKAGVVDAGALGFVDLLAGFVAHLVDGEPTGEPQFAPGPGPAAVAATTDTYTGQRYCTECVVVALDIDRRRLHESLGDLGSSLVLGGNTRKTRIHIHVDKPDEVFAVARRFGDVRDIKADDMHRQQPGPGNATRRFAVVVDSAADIPEADLDRLEIHVVPCHIQFGDRAYLDKVSITTQEFFAELAASDVLPTTSQPSPGDFRRQFEHLASHWPDVISINLSPMVSGTFQAAQSAASRVRASGRIHVVNSKNASLGQGQLAVFAGECAAAGLDVDTTLRAVRRLVPNTVSFGLIPDLRYAVRGGRIPKSRKLLADLLRVTPVIHSKPRGGVAAGGALPGRRNLLPRFARYVKKRSVSDEPLRLAVAHAVCEDRAHQLVQELRRLMPNIVTHSVTDLGAALGAHCGPGTLVVSLQSFVDPASLAAGDPGD